MCPRGSAREAFGPVLAMLIVLTLTAGGSAAVAVLAPQLGPEAGLAPTSVGLGAVLRLQSMAFTQHPQRQSRVN